MRKVIKIRTNLFDLSIKWNGAIASIECAVLLGTFMLRLFSDNPAVDRLAVIILVFNVIAIIASTVIGMQISVEDETDSVKKEKVETTVDRRAIPKEESSKESKASKPREIRNKVPVPTASSKQEPVPTVESEPKQDEVVTPEEPVKTLEQMTDSDWEALFKMD